MMFSSKSVGRPRRGGHGEVRGGRCRVGGLQAEGGGEERMPGDRDRFKRIETLSSEINSCLVPALRGAKATVQCLAFPGFRPAPE